jgi:diguanylate cyclase (GGDEF)-like protein
VPAGRRQLLTRNRPPLCRRFDLGGGTAGVPTAYSDKELREKQIGDADLLRVRQAIAAAGDVALEWDLCSDSVTWSGYGPFGDFISSTKISTGAEFLRRIVPEDLIGRRRAISSHLQEGSVFDCEYRIYGDASERIWVNERGSIELDENGRPSRLVGTLRVITHRKEHEARLRYEAQHDTLTGLYNRVRLAESLDDVVRYNAQFGSSGAYFAVGVDRLTIINDAFGHETGDAVLVEFSQRLQTLPPIGDMVGRLGGDCFGIVVADCPQEKIDAVAERVIETLRATPIDTPSGPVFVTGSIGAVTVSGNPESAHDIMARADVAQREAKRAGRNCFVRYTSTSGLRKGHQQHIAIAERVQAALKNDRLTFAYQPIVDAGTGLVSHYECLLRMVESGGEIVAAGAFMPVIEEMGLVRQIDRKVLEMAARDLRRNPDVTLAINVSGLTACDRGWVELLKEQAANTPNMPERLIIEITETMALRDIDDSVRFVNAVRELGCQVALDDFGAGYTSFRNLRALAVDVVKIDGSFVRDVAHSPDNRLFIQSLVGLARGFSLRTVAECVETADDAEVLVGQGIDFLQGYYFGRPTTDAPWLNCALASPVAAPTPTIGRH